MPTFDRPARRRAGAAFAAAGLLSLAGAAPADPPSLAAPDASGLAAPGGESAEAALHPLAIPGLAAPPSLGAPSETLSAGPATRTPDPAPLRVESWRSLAAPSADTPPAVEPERLAATPDEADSDAVDGDGRERRGWLSFAPRRVRPASNFGSLGYGGEAHDGAAAFYSGTYSGGSSSEDFNLSPQPDPISSPRTAYMPQDLGNAGPAPAPMPLPGGLAAEEDLNDDRSYEPVPPSAPRPAPPRAADMPPRPATALPPNTVIRNGVPVRDLRTPEPPPYAPLTPEVDGYGGPYGSQYGAGAPLPPTGVPFGGPGPIAGPAGGFGPGPLAAGPMATLGSAGGMCELGLCDGAVPLFRRVEIEDPDHVHPRAVRQVVAVADPCRPAPPIGLAKLFHRECTGCLHGCRECDPTCDEGTALVFVEVCVPPCQPEEVKVTRHGYRVHMDFGKYEVTLTSRDGYVKVDYDD